MGILWGRSIERLVPQTPQLLERSGDPPPHECHICWGVQLNAPTTIRGPWRSLERPYNSRTTAFQGTPLPPLAIPPTLFRIDLRGDLHRAVGGGACGLARAGIRRVGGPMIMLVTLTDRLLA